MATGDRITSFGRCYRGGDAASSPSRTRVSPGAAVRLDMLKGAVLLAATIFFVAMAFDLAVYFARMGRAQWEADGIATAAAGQLALNGSQDDALAAAGSWLGNNHLDASNAQCCTFADSRPVDKPDGILDTVTATVRVSHGTFFLHYLGFPEKYYAKQSATAQVVGARGAPICPWAVVADSSASGSDFGFVPGRVYTFNLNDRSSDGGTLVPLDLKGGGVTGYEAILSAGCRKEDVGTWSVGQTVHLLPSTDDAPDATLRGLVVHYQFESADGSADYMGNQWCDVTTDPDGNITGFNPYVQGPREECVRGSNDGGLGRLVVVPIVSQPADGAARILGLASLYIASWDRGASAGKRVDGVFFDRARPSVDNVNLVGVDDTPLAPLRISLSH